MRNSFINILLCACIYTGVYHTNNTATVTQTQTEPSWNSLSFPSDFIFGAATEACKIEGLITDDPQVSLENNYTQSPRKSKTYYPFFRGCDHWARYKEDVQLIKQIGTTAYRFSIPWYRIEPTQGVYDYEAIAHYKELIHELKMNNIEPWVCLHHFKHPAWFEQKGSFYHKENIKHFVKFCTDMFTEFHKDVHYWATFNEPMAYIAEAYITGSYPPHYQGRLISAQNTLHNMLSAHKHVYKKCKAIDKSAYIGLIKMFLPFAAYNNNYLEKNVVRSAHWFTNTQILESFKQEKDRYLDFIGVNYYQVKVVRFDILHPTKSGFFDGYGHELRMTDNGHGINPTGLSFAIKQAMQLNIPIYITEIGISDHTQKQHDYFFRNMLNVIQKHIAHGADIRGCFIWSLMGDGYGFYKVDKNTYKRTLQPGFSSLIQFIKNRKEVKHV